MKKILSAIPVLAMVILLLASCGKAADNKTTDDKEKDTAKVEQNSKINAVVTILPQAEWVKAVGGDLVEVATLLPPGASPATYQPSPKEMTVLEDADVYFTISVPTEVEAIIPSVSNKDKIVDLAKIVGEKYPDLNFSEEHHHHEDADHDHDHDHDKDDHHEDADHDHDYDHDKDDHHEDADHDHDHDHDKDDHHEDADHDHNHDHDKDDDNCTCDPKATDEESCCCEENEKKEDCECEVREDADHHHEDEDHHHEDGEEHHHHHHSGRDPHIWMSPKRVVVMVEAIRDKLIELDKDNAETYKKNAATYIEKLNEKDKELKEVLGKVTTKSFIIMHPSMGYFGDDYGLTQVSIEKEGKQATAEHLKTVIDYAQDHQIKVIFYQKEFDNNQAKTIASEVGGEVMELEPLNPNYLENLDKVKDAFGSTLK